MIHNEQFTLFEPIQLFTSKFENFRCEVFVLGASPFVLDMAGMSRGYISKIFEKTA